MGHAGITMKQQNRVRDQVGVESVSCMIATRRKLGVDTATRSSVIDDGAKAKCSK